MGIIIGCLTCKWLNGDHEECDDCFTAHEKWEAKVKKEAR